MDDTRVGETCAGELDSAPTQVRLAFSFEREVLAGAGEEHEAHDEIFCSPCRSGDQARCGA